ncbi:MAG: ArsA family ATPase [Deltaproteobacteria bacterium]|nr:ArsA family ATPase [Deltaproteobacteria bacterium]
MLADLVRDHRVVVCVGSGGVGKTTTAATIALWGALEGRRAVVLTIDPARRLANSLGIAELGDEPRQVDAVLLATTGRPVRGSLAAMMLDQKNAWDRLVARHAPSDDVRERILRNRFYLNLSQNFAGSHEYMAIEQLCLLCESDAYDLIVLDTPPTKRALDFFEAPERIRDFLDRKIVRWFLMPYLSQGWAAAKAMNRTVGFLFRKLEEATGVSALAEVSDFFSAMSGMFDAFTDRTDVIHDILRASTTAFVLVTGPEEQVLTEAEFFSGRMRSMRMPLGGVVFNRVHEELSADAGTFPGGTVARLDEEVVRAALADAGVAGPHVAWLASNFVDYQLLARGEAIRMEQFRAGLSRRVPFVTVPNFDTDVHDLASLTRMHAHLFGATAPSDGAPSRSARRRGRARD